MDNLFTADSEIAVSKSPYSAYEGEEMVYDGRLTPISIEHIMFKVKRGHVYGMDFVILEALSELEFATSRMVTQYLLLKNIDIEQSKVHNRLKFMNKINIISRFFFRSKEGMANTRIYCLEKAGKYLLLSRNYRCSWKASDNIRPIDVVKEILARNQLLLSYRNKVSNLKHYKINPYFKNIKIQKPFRPHLLLNVEYENKDGEKEIEQIFFEFVRSYEGFEEKFKKRMEEYREFYEDFRPTPEMPRLPQLVIVGEDDKHNFDLFRILYKEQELLKNISPVFTSDLRCLEKEINRSITNFSFIEGQGKKVAGVKVLNYKTLV